MPHYFKPTEKDLRIIRASELFPGAIFWLKQDNGEFHECKVDLSWYKTKEELDAYRKLTTKYSMEQRLFTRRDKAFKSFLE